MNHVKRLSDQLKSNNFWRVLGILFSLILVVLAATTGLATGRFYLLAFGGLRYLNLGS